MLLPGDGPENYREVTPAEREQIEKDDAAWTRPPQAFIDHWRARAEDFGGYNEQTGFFELNEITDIDYEEALAIDCDSFPACVGRMDDISVYSHSYPRGRTLFPLKPFGARNFTWVYSYVKAEVLRMRDGYGSGGARVGNCTSLFLNCYELRRILGFIQFEGLYNDTQYMFSDCWKLEEVTIIHASKVALSLDFSKSPLLSLHSIQQLVELKTSAYPTAVALHADTFAKLPDELIAQAAEKQITFQTA